MFSDAEWEMFQIIVTNYGTLAANYVSMIIPGLCMDWKWDPVTWQSPWLQSASRHWGRQPYVHYSFPLLQQFCQSMALQLLGLVVFPIYDKNLPSPFLVWLEMQAAKIVRHEHQIQRRSKPLFILLAIYIPSTMYIRVADSIQSITNLNTDKTK
jgi:hypothetical protein